MKKWILITLLVMGLASIPRSTSQAARGKPGTGEFGYGATLNLDGPNLEDAIDLLGDLQLDWLAIDFSWMNFYPQADTQPNWSVLDKVIQAAESNHTAVMLSITHAPAWAMTANGPNPKSTRELIGTLMEHYPDQISALEIFPGANTINGWGVQPDPAVYARFISYLQNSLAGNKHAPILVCGGLIPQPSNVPDGNIDDIQFLQTMYQNNAIRQLFVISIRYYQITGQPVQSADDSEQRVLRHYQEIRRIMLKNKHENGLIWLTRVSAPDGSINRDEDESLGQQTVWLAQAFAQVKTQVYIGAAFYNSINNSPEDTSQSALLIGDHDFHPFYRVIENLIAGEEQQILQAKRGSLKNGDIIKQRP
jgi:hypothetical protein